MKTFCRICDVCIGAMFYLFLRLLVEVFSIVYFRIRIEGRENIPKNGAFLLCPNHRSFIDGPLTAHVTWRRMRYLIKKSIFDVPLLGPLMLRAGAIPVDRSAFGRDSLRTIMNGLEKGLPHVIFPEGKRNVGPTLGELHTGTAYLALRAGVPIVPLGMGFTAKAFGKGDHFIKPRKLVFSIGKPIYVERTTRVDREAMTELNQKIARALQEEFDRAESRTTRELHD